jgi:hypothetical protein
MVGRQVTFGHLEKLLSPPIADSPRVNVHESEREQSGISWRQFCGVRRLAAIFRGAHLNIRFEILFLCGSGTSCLLLDHGAAPKTASRDLSALSSPNGDQGTQTNGTEGAQGNQIQR